MTARHSPFDRPFFAQWLERAGRPRTLDSSRVLLEILSPTLPPSMAIVGSKGKGSAAAGATAALASAGLTVITITSPAHVTNRERIRIGGRAIDETTYAELGNILGSLLPSLPPEHYLSPSGAYSIMGLHLASELGADVIVMEEGMGGGRDEVGLIRHRALGLTEVFAEHVGILGANPAEIAAELLDAGGPSVELLATAPQAPQIASLVEERRAAWRADLVSHEPLPHRNRLVGTALGLGFHLGAALANSLGASSAPPQTMELPGRSSVHRRGENLWFVDGAISPAGVRAALESCPFTPDLILGAWPDDKDGAGCSKISGARRVRAGEHLSYAGDLPHWRQAIEPGNIAAIGTQSFVGEVLEYLGVATDLMWSTGAIE